MFREANTCADALAKHGHNCSVGLHLFHSFLAFLSLELIAELSGHCRPRFFAV